jgi:hypothetical protein
LGASLSSRNWNPTVKLPSRFREDSFWRTRAIENWLKSKKIKKRKETKKDEDEDKIIRGVR